MTWHRSDDGFPEHPKSDALAEHFGDDWATCAVAFMTWHHMGCDCASRRTDGVFNAARAHRVIRAPREVIDRALAGLLKVGFLDKHRDGFVFHDWAEYQPTRAELDAERAAKTARQARWRAGKSSKVDGGETPKETGGSARVDGAVDASTTASVDGGVEGAPSRPVPSRPDREEKTPARAREDEAPKPGTLTGRDAFDALADDARGVADFIGQAYELSAVRMLGAARLTRSEVRALAEALKSPAAWWPKGTRDGVPERVTLKRLAGYPSKSESGGYECGPLSDLIAHVRAKATAPVARPADPAPVFVNLGRNNRPLHRGA